MSEEHRADAALRALREIGIPDAPSHVEARRRRQVIERLERRGGEGLSSAHRHRWIRLSAAALVLAVLGVSVLVLWNEWREPSVANAPAQARAATQLNESVRPMALGSEVKTDVGSTVQLKTALGARISVGGASELRLKGGQQPDTVERVELARGSIRVKVPKLGPRRQFRVSTPDTLVIVHGTEFRVTVHAAAAGRTNTEVEVLSGRVEVRKKQTVEFLDAGGAWSSRDEAAPPARSSESKGRSKSSASPEPGGEAARSTKATSKQVDARDGRLARANALLTSALEAARNGKDELALARLEELLRRYPDSPVADNARVERFRALRRLGREQDAARAASGYLKGDPDGLARDEARELGK